MNYLEATQVFELQRVRLREAALADFGFHKLCEFLCNRNADLALDKGRDVHFLLDAIDLRRRADLNSRRAFFGDSRDDTVEQLSRVVRVFCFRGR